MNSELQDILKQACAKSPMTYRDYIETALYHPTYGYYTQKKQRVGRSSQTDFYTSESLGKVFAELVINASQSLLKDKDLSSYHFIEIGAEPGSSLLSQFEEHPFKQESVIRQGEPLSIQDEPIVLFANEWLDALPFHRLVFLNGKWYEKAITLNSQNHLTETLLEKLSDPIQPLVERLPSQTSHGYQIDLSPETQKQIQLIADQKWTGLVMLFDYGKTWNEMTTQMPNGSARTYFQHKQGTDLLNEPGNCDITFDVCWDLIQETFDKNMNTQCELQSQEAFFVNHAQVRIQEILSQSQFTFSQEKQTLLELIHPANMGQKFQTLHALRK
ncbi:MAG: SAM-dependent methyltransferase [Coraliomargaritaceae bacterium]